MKEICVNTTSLSAPGEGEQMIPPENGDRISVQIEGIVSRIEGDRTYINAETANGEPLPEELAPMEEPSLDAERAALEAEMEKY
ncbi:MAG: hypothetical protein AAFX93_14120 [Verrucomicrobiota bacterium]